MKSIFSLAVISLFSFAFRLSAQPLHYDPYLILPGTAGGMGIDAGMATTDFEHVSDTSELFLVGKYSPSDRLEIGTWFGFGPLNDAEDSFHALQVGTKWSVGQTSVATLGFLLPCGDIDDLGLSVGWMHIADMGGTRINYHFQLGFLDGYTEGSGTLVDLVVELVKDLDEQVIGYLDFRTSTQTKEVGDHLAIDLAPNLDYVVVKGVVINAGFTLGVAGDAKQDDVGLFFTLIKTMEGR